MPVWLWFFTLLVVSVFAGLLVYMEKYQRGEVPEISFSEFTKPPAADQKQTQKSPTNNKGSQQSASKNKEPQFDFYSLLPEMEVVVPDKEISQKPGQKMAQDAIDAVVSKALKDPEKPVLKPSPSSNLFLQAGAFKTTHSADRMKAALAFIGIESRVVSVDLATGKWHRVRVGPFSNLVDLREIRGRMKSNNIDSVLVKVNAKKNS